MSLITRYSSLITHCSLLPSNKPYLRTTNQSHIEKSIKVNMGWGWSLEEDIVPRGYRHSQPMFT
ncbi:MAG TPA: hypothetical protein VFF49_08535, partial [Thermodesulfobacteriota bacterium]|nr:hypothetical protein [Thermodesulfobacteriota bacterium]